MSKGICPQCHKADLKVGWPTPGPADNIGGRQRLKVPLTCKLCGHEWTETHQASTTEGELADSFERAP